MQNNETNKTAIIIAIMTFLATSLLALCLLYYQQHRYFKEKAELLKQTHMAYETESHTTHPFNHCLIIAMTEARNAGKPLTAPDAKELCFKLVEKDFPPKK